MANGTPTLQDGIALVMMLPEAYILAAFGLMLSTFTIPTLGAGFGLGFWIAAARDDLVNLTVKADATTKMLAKAVNYILPALARFNFREAAVYLMPVSIPDVLAVAAYGGLYAAALVAVGAAILERREML